MFLTLILQQGQENTPNVIPTTSLDKKPPRRILEKICQVTSETTFKQISRHPVDVIIIFHFIPSLIVIFVESLEFKMSA